MTNVKKNIAYQISYDVIVLLIPLVLSPYLTRVLGSDNIGIYSFTYTTASYFVLFANLGIKNYANREIARNRENPEELNKTFTGILILHTVLSIAVSIAYLVYCFFINSNNDLYVKISGIYVISVLFDISWLFFGLEQFKLTVMRNGVIRLATAASVFLFVRNENDLWIYVLIMALSNFLSQVYLWGYIGRFVKLVPVPVSSVTKHLPGMLVLFIPTIAISLYNYMDKIMVGAISGDSQLGFYEMSEKIPAIAITVIGSVGTVMMPRMSSLMAKEDYKQGQEYVDNSMHFVVWLSIAMAFGIAGVSEVFAPVYWGEEFAPCAGILLLLAIILPIKGFANVIRTQYLIPRKKDKQYILSVCCGAIVNLIVNIALISRLQSVGAAIGTIAAEFAVCLVQSLSCRKELPIKRYIKNSIPYILGGVIMFLVVNAIGIRGSARITTLLLQTVIGIVVYVAFSILWISAFNRPLLNKIIGGLRRSKG